MKLYVRHPHNNSKVYLNIVAPTRTSLASIIGSNFFILGGVRYSVRNVLAENDSNSTATGAVVGGVVGALAGPVGIFIGGLLGGVIGNGSDDSENRNIRKFNKS